MRTPATVKRHPIHPMLIAVPIGLWVFALISDIIYVTGLGRSVWAQVAFYCIGGGIVGVLIAAIPGLIDLLSIHEPRAKRIGIFHMIMNLVGVVLFAWNWWLRLHNPNPAGTPFLLTIIGVLLVGISGWLGADIVHVFGFGVEDDHPRTNTP